MVWLLIAASIYAIIFVAGRAHSRYLDRLEARPRVVMTVQLFNVSPDLVKETEFTVDLTSEAIRNIPIESLDSFSVRNGSQTCVSAPTADNRTFNHGIRLVPDEAELIAFNKQNPPGEVAQISFIENRTSRLREPYFNRTSDFEGYRFAATRRNSRPT